MSFVEIDGAKFVPDETDPSKAKIGDDGKPVPFVEPKPVDVSKMSVEDLAKANPAFAQFFDSHKELQQKIADREAAEAKKAEEDATKNGEWQKLADERAKKLGDTEGTLKQKEEMLGKYVESTKKILEAVKATIPKDKLSLIPESFSPREQLEYIVANAKLLGASTSFDGTIPKSDNTPTGTEEDKMNARMDELRKKGTNMTSAERTELANLGIKLTQLRREKADKK